MKHVNMKMLMGLLAIVLLLGGMGAECAPLAAAPAPEPAPPGAPASETVQRAATGEAGGGRAADGTKAGSDEGIQPMIVKTAELSVVVPDTKQGLEDVTRIATQAQGYRSSSNMEKRGDRLLATVVIRVPAASFESALTQLKALGDVQADSVSGQDVTGEYVDLAARLKNLEAAEKELLVLMTEVREKSGKAEDVLAIYDRIVAIRGEIETIKGRMKYLADRADMSTITVHLSPTLPETEVVPGGWYPDQTLKDAVSALVTLLQILINLGIWLTVFSVCLIPFVVVGGVFLLIVYIRRRRARRARVGT
jgi:hypothetical protein